MDNLRVTSLVRRAQEGDRAAFEELTRAFAGFVFSLALRMLGNRADAEDVFQDTFLRAWNHLPSFQTHRSFGPWIKRIAVNLCLDRLKARTGEPIPLQDGHLRGGSTSGPEVLAGQEEQHHLVQELLLRLPPRHRAAVVLFYLEERSVREVAATLRKRPGTIRVWLFRAREKMRAALEERGHDPANE